MLAEESKSNFRFLAAGLKMGGLGEMRSNGEITEREELREAILQSWLCTAGLTPKLHVRGSDLRWPRKDSET